MKLTKISIQNYRSITSVKSIPIENYCIILGKNNEGKTNVLNAINLAMVTLKSKAMDIYDSKQLYKEYRKYKYSYDRDYPITLKQSKGSSPTKLTLKFQFSEDEIRNFVSRIGLGTNGNLSIEIVFDKDNNSKINVLEKRGRGAVSYKEKIKDIVSFLVENIVFQYIPAIRTEEDSLDILNELVNQEFEFLAEDEEYNKAINTVHSKQVDLMNELSSKVSQMIKVFLPTIQETQIELDERNSWFRRNIDFYVNDGAKTHISYKGDGVKSLITLALLNSSKQTTGSRIIAIEEPESHLHPEAIHQINNVIEQLSNTSQVIITTHNGSFVNRGNISSNIIIDKGIGKKANSIQEIRELLGIQLSDNLISSETVIIVEGSDDCLSLEAVFSKMSSNIKNAIKNKKLAFTDMGGATNLKYKCALYSSMMCKYFVIVDGDKCGISSYIEAKQKGLVQEKNAAILYAYGDKKESEFEDFLKKDFYEDIILADYGVNLNVREFRGCKYKWSDRLKRTFIAQSKLFGDQTEAEIKEKIASKIAITDNIEEIFPECYIETLKNICSQIESVL